VVADPQSHDEMLDGLTSRSRAEQLRAHTDPVKIGVPRSRPGRPATPSSRTGQRVQSAQMATWEPVITVRWLGSPKASIGLLELRAIPMNSFFRHRAIPAVSVCTIVMRETK